MSNEAQLDELLYRWEELAGRGQRAAPEELCADCPELAEELARRVKVLEEMDSVFDTSTHRRNTAAPDSDFELPGYEILTEIGSGGMGVVYKARQIQLDRIVAIKTLRGGPDATVEEIDRFHTEAESVAKLSHPGIVSIHDVGEVDGRHFFSMDFVEGQTLEQLIRDKSLSGERAARYLQSIAQAVDAAHEQGILHRDLKPSNVLIDLADQLRITDFGLAKRIEGASKHTATGEILGTPSFMPPEQATGDNRQVNRRSDVYALGGLLYAMLTGRPPFRADTSVATVLQVINDEPVAPRRLNTAIDRDLETICLKCLEKNPGARYATARQVAEECERFLAGRPIHARPISTLARGRRWCRRNPMSATLAAAIVVSLLAGTGVSTYFAIQSNRFAIASDHNAKTARRKHREAIDTLEKLQREKLRAEQNEQRAKQAETKAVTQASQLKTQTQLLRTSIHSYLKMYLRTCTIGGEIAAADDVRTANAAFARFASTNQLVTNNRIIQARDAIQRHLIAWREQADRRPKQLSGAVLELTKQCRLAWEYRCDAIVAGGGGRRRGGGQKSTVIRELERQLIVEELYNRVSRAARGMADASDFNVAMRFRYEFDKLFWGELQFVANTDQDSIAVEGAMVRIRECVKDWRQGPPPNELAQCVVDLETACKHGFESTVN